MPPVTQSHLRTQAMPIIRFNFAEDRQMTKDDFLGKCVIKLIWRDVAHLPPTYSYTSTLRNESVLTRKVITTWTPPGDRCVTVHLSVQSPSLVIRRALNWAAWTALTSVQVASCQCTVETALA